MSENKNYYFNEENFREKILSYQKSCKVNEENIAVEKDKILETQITKDIEKIIIAIINKYRYWQWENVEDMKQHAAFECFKNYLKYTPEKGTAFNFFSKIARVCLFNYTTRREKHRGHLSLDCDYNDDSDDDKDIRDVIEFNSNSLNYEKDFNFDLFLDDLEESLFKIINDKFDGDILIKYEKIASIILEYLKENKNFVGKSDLYSFARGFGMRNSDVRKFIYDIGAFKSNLFEGVIK